MDQKATDMMRECSAIAWCSLVFDGKMIGALNCDHRRFRTQRPPATTEASEHCDRPPNANTCEHLLGFRGTRTYL